MIRWEEGLGEYSYKQEKLGYLGRIITASITNLGEQTYAMTFFFTGGCTYYSTLSSAKRGAERMLERFLRDAGLEVKK